jgi:hypothetical protein
MEKLLEQLQKNIGKTKQLHDEEIKLYKDLISVQKDEITMLKQEVIWLLVRKIKTLGG